MISVNKTKTIVAIPNPIVRVGVKNILKKMSKLELISIYSSIKDVPKVYSPELLVFDSETDQDLKIAKELINKHKAMKVILLSSHKRLSFNFIFSKNTFVDAFLYEKIEPIDFIEKIDFITQSENKRTIYFPRDIVSLFFGVNVTKPITFTNRECQVLEYLSRGKTTQEIAEKLHLSIRTVDSHRQRMMTKLGTKNIIPVILYAVAFNFISQFKINGETDTD